MIFHVVHCTRAYNLWQNEISRICDVKNVQNVGLFRVFFFPRRWEILANTNGICSCNKVLRLSWKRGFRRQMSCNLMMKMQATDASYPDVRANNNGDLSRQKRINKTCSTKQICGWHQWFLCGNLPLNNTSPHTSSTISYSVSALKSLCPEKNIVGMVILSSKTEHNLNTWVVAIGKHNSAVPAGCNGGLGSVHFDW